MEILGFNPKKHNLKTEIMAGLTSFVTMSYILAVNPDIFSHIEQMSKAAVFTSTAIVGIISTLIVAFIAKMPYGIAPGMGPNAFFVFTICMGMGYSWQFALTAILIEGFVLLFLTLSKLREALVRSIPQTIINAITVGIGLFIAFVGLQNSGLIVNDEATLVKLGPLAEGSGQLTLIGLVITSVLVIKNIKGALLIGILATTIIGIPMGLTQYQGIVSLPESPGPIFCKFAFDQILTTDMLVVVVSFLFIDLFSLTGSAIGVCKKTGSANRLFIADSIGTIASGVFGTSAACTFIESSAGVEQGGRTGVTALTIALCFAASLFLSPVFLAIPSAATAPVLIIVGLSMFKTIKNVSLEDESEAIPFFITIITMPLAYSIADGILIGIISYVIINLISGKFKKLSPGMYILATMFILRYIFL